MSMPRKIRCTVETVTDHGERVYTVALVPQVPVPAFRPGQFLHLTIDDYDPSGFWPDSRVFSIASSPGDRWRIRLCYAVKGRYTMRMEKALRPGADVWIKLPYGEFVIDDTRDVVLMAGGTGISAFTAFIEALVPGMSRTVWLVYGARTPDLWLFREMIERQVKACPTFSAFLFAESGLGVSRPPPVRGPACPAPSLLGGRISLDPLLATLDRQFLTSALFYLSGPPPMLASLKADLQTRGLSPEHIHTDAWD
jgi:ferredoxin-NADP reductase